MSQIQIVEDNAAWRRALVRLARREEQRPLSRSLVAVTLALLVGSTALAHAAPKPAPGAAPAPAPTPVPGPAPAILEAQVLTLARAGLKLVNDDKAEEGFAKLDQAVEQAAELPLGRDAKTALLQIHGQALFAAGWNDAALEKFRAALALKPGDGALQLDLAKALLEAEDYRGSISTAEQALRSGLAGEAAADARATIGKARSARLHAVLGITANLSVGFTSNVLNDNIVETIGGYRSRGSQKSPSRSSDVKTESSFPFTADVGIEGRLVGQKRAELWLGYELSQLAYPEASQEGFALQSHDLSAHLDLTPSKRFKLKLELDESASFSGLTSFAPNQIVSQGSIVASLKHRAGLQSSLTFKDSYSYSLDRAGASLDANSFTAKARERLKWKWLRTALAYQFRLLTSGVLDSDVYYSGNRSCTTPCVVGHLVSPRSFQGHMASLTADIKLPWKVTADLALNVEHRLYRDAVQGFALKAPRPLYNQQRRDTRLGVELSLARELPHGLALELDTSYLRNFSNILVVLPVSGAVLDDRDFQTATVVLKASWAF